jgi:hypothetical protein
VALSFFKEAEMNKNIESWAAAGIFGVNDIIDPAKTRTSVLITQS